MSDTCLHSPVTPEEREELKKAIDESGRGQMLTFPRMKFEPMPTIVTQAKYFHYAEVDGQKAMIGFQTYEELRFHLAGGEDEASDPLCNPEAKKTAFVDVRADESEVSFHTVASTKLI